MALSFLTDILARKKKQLEEEVHMYWKVLNSTKLEQNIAFRRMFAAYSSCRMSQRALFLSARKSNVVPALWSE